MLKTTSYFQSCNLVVNMKWLFLLPVLIALLSTSSAKRGFILTGPKLYDVGENETLVLHLFDIKESGSVKIRMVNLTGDEVYSEVTVPIENGQSTSVQFPVPSTLPEHLNNAKLEVDGLVGGYRLNKSLEVKFRTRGPIVFINTDKPLYKAGQTVKIRVLVTDVNLRPHREGKVGQIWITDPNRVRIAQWSDVSLSGGLIHEEMPLPEEPVLGRWHIEVKIDNNVYSRTFKVEEYVLPTFEVKIKPPPYIVFNAKNATWEVCARYTYGKPVKGELYAKLSQSPNYWQEARKHMRYRTEIKGCAKLTFPVEELRNTPGYYPFQSLELYAEVTEEGTGTKMNSTSTTTPTNIPYTINSIDGPRYFRPGIPLKVTMDVKTPDSKSISDQLIKVCLDVVRKKWSDTNTIKDTVKVCRNYTSDKDGKFLFTIPPQDPNTVSLSVRVEAAIWKPVAIGSFSLQKPDGSFTLSPWFSASGSHIQLERIQKIDCSPDNKVNIPFHIAHSKTGIIKMHYQVMSRGDIVKQGDFDIRVEQYGTKNVTDDTYLPDHPTSMCADNGIQWDVNVKPAKFLSLNYLSFEIDDKMAPRVRILLYTVTDDGDIIADSISYDIDPCFANQVEMRFGEEKQSPGTKATIYLTAESQSLCSVGVVDKSVYLLHEADLLTRSQINSHLLPLDTQSYTFPDQRTGDYTYCTMRKQGYESVGYLDAISAFADNGGIVLSDLPLETRPCHPAASSHCYFQPESYAFRRPPQALHRPPEIAYAMMGPQHESGIESRSPPPVVTVRTDFPDTWLFQLYKVGDNGSLEMKQQMPDSITEWQGEAICIHPEKGLGLSKPATIIAFQSFFASLTLPHSVVRNEIIPITVTVFNYLKDCLAIKVHLDQTEHFVLYNGTLTKSLCVCGDDSSTIYFHIRPEKIGTMNITATAETTEDQDICGNFDTALGVKRKDTLTKPVLVEAEGFMKEEIFNSYFCLSDEENKTFQTEHLLKLPEESILVPDSVRAYTSVSGDLMGPTLEGLERLVTMPTGCGEQNMIGLVPNIVVLDYLNATNKLKEDVRQKAVGHIRQGYLRQQKYRHSDGSYSAFGQNDEEGSMWLTAFVVRTFASARRYVTIDEGSLETSRKWILSRQRENGCFPMVGTVHHKAMKGGVSKEDETTSTLTAYIIISMLESGKMDKEAVAKGFRCIEAKSKPSNYSKALFSYAAAVAKYNSSSEYLKELISDAEKDGGFLYWKDSDKSIAVETASYAILTLLESGSKEDFLKVPSIAKWLTKQRNSYGGFYSTQDTVMALQALGKYGSIITRESPEMGISVKTNKIREMFLVSSDNELLMQRTNLKLKEDPETSVEITASGTGCALVQTSLRYNIVKPAPSKDFELSVQTQRKPGGECTDVDIRICSNYNHPDGSNMAIIEVKMVTGYSPLIPTVQELLQLKELEIRRYDFKEDINTLYLYIQTLTQNSTCFSFEVTQEIKVLDVKPSSVKVYDYYDEEKSLSVPYSIEETCTE